MKRALLCSSLFTLSLALSVFAPAAHAGGRSGVNWSVSVGSGAIYAPPPPVYAYPPTYLQPQPIYVQPAPVVIYGNPGPVVYGQPYHVERPRHHHNHDYNGGNFRQGQREYYRQRD